MPIGNAVEDGSQILIYNEKGRQIAYIHAYDGLAGYTSSTVSVRWGSQILTYNEKGRQISSVRSGRVNEKGSSEPAASREKSSRSDELAASRKRSQRFDYKPSGIMDKIMEMLVFWLIVAPCTYFLFLRVRDDVSAGGTTTRLEVFGFFESVLIILALVIRKWLAPLLKRVLWWACLAILIILAMALIGYLLPKSK
jgi:hypothetical protein